MAITAQDPNTVGFGEGMMRGLISMCRTHNIH